MICAEQKHIVSKKPRRDFFIIVLKDPPGIFYIFPEKRISS